MAKQLEQVIPPLLPLEYCRLERAANLLKYEVEDIIHWGVIGAIELGILIPRTKPKKVALIVEKGLWPIDSNPLERELCSIGSSPRKDKGPWENNGVSWLFSIEPEDTNSSLNGAIADSFTGLACGLFAVTDGVLIDIESQGYYSGDLWITPADTYENTDQAKVSGLVMADNDASRPKDVLTQVTLKSQDLWITRQQLEKLHHHRTKGTPLPNIYTESELGNRAKEHLRMVDPPSLEAAYTPRGKAIHVIDSLLKLIPDLDCNTINPTKAHSIINAKLAEKGLEPLSVTDRQFRDWLNKVD